MDLHKNDNRKIILAETMTYRLCRWAIALANTHAQAESQQDRLQQETRGISLFLNTVHIF